MWFLNSPCGGRLFSCRFTGELCSWFFSASALPCSHFYSSHNDDDVVDDDVVDDDADDSET